MDRQVSQGQTLIYRYGCGEPSPMAEAGRQLELGTAYWNALVEMEHEYRSRENEAWRSVPAVGPLVDALDKALAGLLAMREQMQRARQPGRPSGRAWQSGMARLAADRREAQERLAAARRDHWPDVQPSIAALGAWRRERAKAIYRAFSQAGLYWGNALLLRDRYEVARRRTEQDRRKDGRPAQLHPRVHDGTGFWAVRLAHEACDRSAPLTMERLFGQKSKWCRLLQIDPVDFTDWDCLPRSERRRRARTAMRIRIASQGRSPVWLELPLVMHRPLPEGGIVKAAQVVRRRIGSHFSYALLLTVHVEGAGEAAQAGREVSVTLGCARTQDGILAAACLGPDGSQDRLVLPKSLMDRLRTLDRLHALRAAGLREGRDELARWTSGRAEPVPTWLQEAIGRGSLEALSACALTWRTHRFPGDESAYAKLEIWRREDKRLWEWEANLRQKCLGFRANLYRTFAHNLAQSYSSAILYVPWQSRAPGRSLPARMADPLLDSAWRRHQAAALHTLQSDIERAFAKAGGRATCARAHLPDAGAGGAPDRD
ncbi:MAG: hypothetical protein ACYCT1_20415, partial [Steroidobacteraceae bacterium]